MIDHDPMRIAPNGVAGEPESTFQARVLELDAPKVLELGTLRWEKNRPTHHQHWVPNASSYTKSDVTAGTDVDVVVDAHSLTSVFQPGSFDALIAVSVWEHLARPWVAMQEVGRVLRQGGIGYISTHHSFPQHGYPEDYTRWDSRGLASMVEWAGLTVLSHGHSYPCTITPPPEVTRWNPLAPAWLNSSVMFTRLASTAD